MRIKRLLQKLVCSIGDCTIALSPTDNEHVREMKQIPERLDRLIEHERRRRNPVERVFDPHRRTRQGGRS